MPEECGRFLTALIFSVLTFAAIVFSFLVVVSCEFIKYTDSAVDLPDGATLSAGLFTFEVPDVDGCVRYSESEVDLLNTLEKTAAVSV